jgi:CMP/dCMP kinase
MRFAHHFLKYVREADSNTINPSIHQSNAPNQSINPTPPLMILTISGVPGSGKTSVGKIIAANLNLPFYSVGELRGKMALERGMTLAQLNELGEREAFTDHEIDDYQKKLGESGDSFVIEGRLSWHFIPQAFKIYLDCGLDEAANRVFSSSQLPGEGRDDERYVSIEETKEAISTRMASDDRRYEKYYGLNYRDPSHYDLVIDTTDLPSKEATAGEIMKALAVRNSK